MYVEVYTYVVSISGKMLLVVLCIVLLDVVSNIPPSENKDEVCDENMKIILRYVRMDMT